MFRAYFSTKMRSVFCTKRIVMFTVITGSMPFRYFWATLYRPRYHLCVLRQNAIINIRNNDQSDASLSHETLDLQPLNSVPYAGFFFRGGGLTLHDGCCARPEKADEAGGGGVFPTPDLKKADERGWGLRHLFPFLNIYGSIFQACMEKGYPCIVHYQPL